MPVEVFIHTYLDRRDQSIITEINSSNAAEAMQKLKDYCTEAHYEYLTTVRIDLLNDKVELMNLSNARAKAILEEEMEILGERHEESYEEYVRGEYYHHVRI